MLLDASLARMRRRLSSYMLSAPTSVAPATAPTTPPPVVSCAVAAATAAVAAAAVPAPGATGASAAPVASGAKAPTPSAAAEPDAESRASEAARRRRARRSVRDGAIARAARLSRPSRIVRDGDELGAVLAHVPARFRGRDLQAAFSTMEDGVSLHTLYAAVRGADPVLLLVRDSLGATFGAYTSVPLRAGPHYHGSGEGFVFALRPNVVVFPWTRKNSFFQLGSNDSLAVGGGGSFALFLDSMLEHGSSGESDTYGNRCLASADQFEVVVVEAYRLVVPSRLAAGQ